MSGTSDAFDRMLQDREIIVCAGSGGVGKTTTSAVIGLQAAFRGQDVLVMTIDPARRLANSLGIESLGDEAQEIPLDQFEEVGVEAEGRLSAMMLDMKSSFDRLVVRQAPDEETKREILDNRIYQYFSTSLSGTQEYAAAERLYEIHQSHDYDLLVLDTPPTIHALDFLEAPQRMAQAVESKAFQWLYERDVFKGESGSGFGLFSVGSSYVLKTLSKFTGRELLEEMSVFLQSFSPMFEGFKERAERVRDLLTGERCSFLVVTSPDPHTKDEALHFYEELGTERVAVEGFIVNRVHPHWVERDEFDREPEKLADTLAENGPDPPFEASERVEVAEKLLENAASFYVMALKDARSIEQMRDYLDRDIPIATVPYFAQDIHSLSGLDRVRRSIFG